MFVAGCASTSLSQRYSILEQEPETELVPLTGVFTLVADNQVHHLYGDPYWLRSEFTDKFVSVAVRPVQLDLYGQDLLRWTMERNKRTPVVHLGDALDIGCSSEFVAFLAAMQPLERPWVLTPGNHDGFFMGNLALSPDWVKACKHGGGPVSKAAFVELYLRALAGQGTDAGCQALRAALPAVGKPLPLQGNWRYGADQPAFLRRVAWKIDRADPWRSYVAQEIDLTIRGGERPVRAVLVDTAQYWLPPSFPNGAGLIGEVGRDQQRLVTRWMSTVQDDQATVVMGHHHYGQLPGPSKRWIDELRAKYNAMLYVSAHTHAGRFYVRGETADSSWLELNVGSVLDWPPEYRTFQIVERASGDGGMLIRTKLKRLYSLLREGPGGIVCAPEWEAKPGDIDDYISYRRRWSPFPEVTQQNLANAMLASSARLLRFVPTRSGTTPRWPAGLTSDAQTIAKLDEASRSTGPYDDKVALLIAFERFEATRTPSDETLRQNYRLCQALWATKYEELGARAPMAEDWLLEFQKE